MEGGCKNLQAPLVEIQMCPGMSTHYTHSSCRDWDHKYCGRNGCIRRGSGAVPAGTGVQQSVGEPPAGGSVSAAWASAEGQAILKTAQCAAGGRCNQGGDGALSGRCHSCQAACHVVCMQVVNEGHACTSCRPEQAGLCVEHVILESTEGGLCTCRCVGAVSSGAVRSIFKNFQNFTQHVGAGAHAKQ